MHRIKGFLSLCVFIAIAINTTAQLPKTEIWVFDLKPGISGYEISNPTKIKVGNEYNNQPCFTRDGETMYFVSNGKKGGKTDIYKYSFNKRKKIKRITKTKNEAEYSPMLTPAGDRISCVRVAKDTVTQNLCTYNLKGKKPEIMFPQIGTFGYYCWRSQIELMAFHVPEPFVFKKHNIPYNKHDSLQVNIGRCIKNVQGKILYTDKSDSTNWKIKMLNPKRIGNRVYKTIEDDVTISSTLEGEEDYTIMLRKDLLMGKDGFIYRKKNIFTNPSSSWEPFLDLNHYQIYNFYRIAVSPVANRIAIVSFSGEKP